MITWVLYPVAKQLQDKHIEDSVMRLCSRCKALALGDGGIELTGREDILTDEYRHKLLPYVKAIWDVLKVAGGQ